MLSIKRQMECLHILCIFQKSQCNAINSACHTASPELPRVGSRVAKTFLLLLLNTLFLKECFE
jgi:hypothetical protein